MKTGKIKSILHSIGQKKSLIIISGVLTLIATFAMSWFSFILGVTLYTNGMGGIQNLIHMFYYPQEYAFFYGVPNWVIYLMGVFIISVIVSGFLQLYGIKNHKIGLIGSIIPLIIGIMIIIGASISLLGGLIRILEIFGGEPLIEGIIPFQLAIPGRFESIASYILIASGSLGIIQITASTFSQKQI